ncbi:MAG TPA: DapH/DapD/GlmU-related protein [Candidatus Acidoferrales bacterium]|nr:DapH/DapD/GlmU-related protein [Candidatus Acidoferrales bacterium]
MLDNLRQDICLARKINVSSGWFGQNVQVFIQMNFLPVITYRIGHFVRKLRNPVFRYVLLIPVSFMRQFSEILSGVHISPSAEIGPGLVLHHVEAIYIGNRKIGRNCVISSGVVVTDGKQPVGDNVFFGAGAKLIVGTVGSNVIISPNSVVVADVADGLTVIGVPARIQIPGGNYTALLFRPEDR